LQDIDILMASMKRSCNQEKEIIEKFFINDV
jgi:hypothetical protein